MTSVFGSMNNRERMRGGHAAKQDWSSAVDKRLPVVRSSWIVVPRSCGQYWRGYSAPLECLKTSAFRLPDGRGKFNHVAACSKKLPADRMALISARVRAQQVPDRDRRPRT